MTAKIAPSLQAERIPVEQIPVVDFEPFRTGGPEERKQAALELAAAFRNVGFAYLGGHGVGTELIDRTFAEAGRFFALPREQKAEVAVEKSSCDRGWFDLGMENLDPDKQEEGDLKEGYRIGNDLPPTTRWSAADCRSTAPTSGPPACPASARPWRSTSGPSTTWPGLVIVLLGVPVYWLRTRRSTRA